MEEKLKLYLQNLNLEEISDIIDISLIVDGNSRYHLNYKVSTSNNLYIIRVTKPGNVTGYTNLSDEFTILKQVEKYGIAPRAIRIDLEYFESPLLIEEYLDGVSYEKLNIASEDLFEKSIKLIAETSVVPINASEFPFKYAYTTYRTNFKAWSVRLEEIVQSSPKKLQNVVDDFKKICTVAQNILEKKNHLLENSKQEFIYNDVHPGNIFWIESEQTSKFIDWQKVSLGDSVFMIALFARRFGTMWGMEQENFSRKVLEAYNEEKQIKNMEDLFYARILERAVSDMIWSVWADVKEEVPIKISAAEESKYYCEAKQLISGI